MPVDYVDQVDRAIEKAIRLESKLPPEVFTMSGPISARNKHFFNNLCEFPGCRYLEVGTFKGASVCCAAWENNIFAVTFDDLSEHPHDKEDFREGIGKNIDLFCNGSAVIFREEDFATAQAPEEMNVYYYDGDHREEPTRKGMTHFLESMTNPHILVVDDYNFDNVMLGVQLGLVDARASGWVPKKEWELKGSSYNIVEDTKDWWNGLYIAVMERE